MAALPPILALDVGSHTVKFGEFSATPNGALTLRRFSVVPLDLDPNKEENRHAAVTQAVRQALSAAGARSGKAIFAVAGHAVFMRGIKLPAVDMMQLDQMVTFEAQQVVPFPLSDVVWDFMVLPSRGAGAEKEAIIVAMKADLLEEEYAAVRRAGSEPAQVDIGILALYNAYLYNYPQPEGCVLLVDLGARSTNVLFLEGERLYTRIIPLAGNTLSQVICNEFQEPFAVAENLKVERGGVSLGGDYESQPDLDKERLWRLLRGSVVRIQAEINRSIIFYRNQGGSAPRQILLTGGSSRLPYLDQFLAEKFGIPVAYFNPFENVTLGPGVDRAALAEAAPMFGEVVGLALRQAGPVPAAISLEPRSVTEGKVFRRERARVLGALGLFLLLFVLAALALGMELKKARVSLVGLQERVASLQGLAAQIDPLAKKNEALTQAFTQGQHLLEARDFWPRILDGLNAQIPTGVWITQLTPTDEGQPVGGAAEMEKGHPAKSAKQTAKALAKARKSGKPGVPQITELEIKGMFEDGLKPEVVNRFVAALADTGLFEIDKQKVSDSILSTETPQGNGPLAWNYSLSLKLKEPVSLTP